MKLLLDQGLPRSTTRLLFDVGIDAVHAADVMLGEADDTLILERAQAEGRVVVTLDADFHAELALRGLTGPSVIRIRIEGLRAAQIQALLVDVLRHCSKDLESGAMVTVRRTKIKVRGLPFASNAYDVAVAQLKVARENHELARLGTRKEQVELARAQLAESEPVVRDAAGKHRHPRAGRRTVEEKGKDHDGIVRRQPRRDGRRSEPTVAFVIGLSGR